MVTSCSRMLGWVREAWWSTVSSTSSFRRLGGTGMPSSVARRPGDLDGSRDTPADVPCLGLPVVHSAVFMTMTPGEKQPGKKRRRPGPPAVPVRMTVKRERKLRRIIAAGTSPQRLVLRARIALAAGTGQGNAEIARDLGCSVRVVREWRGRFAVNGVRGIFDRPRSGRPETHGPSARLAVVAVATSLPPDGETAWSQATIARRLGERGLDISRAAVGRVLAEAHVRPHKVRGWLNRAGDPSFWAKAGAVCRLYLSPPPGTVLISIDEKTGIQARSRTHPDAPGRPGRDARREFEYVR